MTVNVSLHDLFDITQPYEIFEDESTKQSARWLAPNFAFFDPEKDNEEELFDPPLPDDYDDDCAETTTLDTKLF